MPEANERTARRALACERLRADGYLELRAGATRTTRAWQSALARSAFALYGRREAWQDLRLPIAAVLAEAYPEAAAEELADLIEAMLPVEEAELVGGPGSGARNRKWDDPANRT